MSHWRYILFVLRIDLDEIPGTHARPYRGPTDHAEMTDLVNSWFEAAGLDERASVTAIDNDYRHLDNCDPVDDMVMIQAEDGHLVGYVRTTWWSVHDGPTRYLVLAHIHPDFFATALARRQMEAAMRRGREIAQTHESPTGRVFEGYTDNIEAFDLGSTYRDLGFNAVTFGVNMVRDLNELPDRPLPPALEVRPVTDDQLRQIWEADGEAFQDHWGSGDRSETEFEAFVDSPTRDNSLWRVAWDGDQVAGQVKSFIDEEENELLGRRRGYTEFISTGRPWRKQGVASALISQSLLALRERGMTEAALGVHGENPTGAYSLYESLGYSVTNEWTVWQLRF